MLLYLELDHFALLDKIVFKPGPCLNILTGETGAGKSLLLDALGAVSGSRVTKDVIRSGFDQARVEAVFEYNKEQLPKALLEELFTPEEIDNLDQGIILSREINRSGRTICRINGRIVPLLRLRELGSNLLDIHGQHESQRIFNASMHQDILDRYGAEQLRALKEDYESTYKYVLDIKKQMQAFGGSEQERARRLDLLSYQANEIKQIKPRPNEDELLQKRRIQLGGAERLQKQSDEAIRLLDPDDGADRLLAEAISSLRAVEDYHDQLPKVLLRLEATQEELVDIRMEISSINESLDFQPELLERIDARLDRLTRLKRKYGETLNDVLAFAEEIEAEILHLTEAEEKMLALNKTLEDALKTLEEKALLLRAKRMEVAENLSKAIGHELTELGMKHARFETEFQALSIEQARPHGMDQLEFMFSANLGEDLKPLARIASGGEAARIMLAIKLILAHAAPLQLLIFDEVDSGVSGETAALVGKKLMELARTSQVMCVTHTAQVAAMADTHFYLYKDVEDGKTTTSVEKLDEEGHLNAVATLLSGSTDTGTSLKLAKALSSEAKKHRQTLLE